MITCSRLPVAPVIPVMTQCLDQSEGSGGPRLCRGLCVAAGWRSLAVSEERGKNSGNEVLMFLEKPRQCRARANGPACTSRGLLAPDDPNGFNSRYFHRKDGGENRMIVDKTTAPKQRSRARQPRHLLEHAPASNIHVSSLPGRLPSPNRLPGVCRRFGLGDNRAALDPHHSRARVGSSAC